MRHLLYGVMAAYLIVTSVIDYAQEKSLRIVERRLNTMQINEMMEEACK